MKFRLLSLLALCVLSLSFAGVTIAQRTGGGQTEASVAQRLEVMSSKLDLMRRSLNSAISSLSQGAKANEKNQKNGDKNKPNADDPVVRLKGMEKEVASLSSEVSDIKTKNDRAEKFDSAVIERLEAAVAEISPRVEQTLQETAGVRKNASATASNSGSKKKKKGGLFGFLKGSGDDKYEELTGAAVAGRDRVLFEEGAKEVRKGHHDTGRLLFATIINTYPDSGFLPLAKLAIADSFFLEGTSSALIQAAQSYQDWLTFFPTDPLAPYAMLKVAEAEMRQMGLSDRDISHARKAEQRLKALLQQFPKTSLRPVVEERLREVQENLAMHDYNIGEFYLGHVTQGKGGLKGAQSRFKEVVQKYPCFSLNDGALFKLATTYQLEEEPDEAAKYYQQLVQNYPESEFNEKAREQLNIIGAPVPEKVTPNTCSKRVQLSFMGNLMQQVSGRADVTTDKDGVLISKDGKEGTDLIDEALKYNGQLPERLTPEAPVMRGTSKPTPTPTPTPAKSPGTSSGNSAVPAAAPTPAAIKP